MDRDLTHDLPLRLHGLRIEGRKSYLVSFGREHMRDPAYLAWLRDRDVVRTLNLPSYMDAPVSEEVVTDYCERMFASERDVFFALHDAANGRFVGTLKAGGIDRYHGLADIGIMIGDKSVWGRGFASDAIAVLAQYLFNTLGLRKLTAGAMAINPAMIAVFEKLGFKREGVLRKQDRYDGGLCDHVLLGCFRNELRIS